FRKVLDVGRLPGPRRALATSTPDLLASVRASGEAIATKVAVLDLDGIDNPLDERGGDGHGFDCVVSPVDVAHHMEELVRVRRASHLAVESSHRKARTHPRVVAIRQ